MGEQRLYQVDAFTSDVLTGNPAAVMPLQAWLEDDVMQAIALENNVSETAFFVPEGEGFRLRWFTPRAEVDLCGHATLATAWVVFNALDWPGEQVVFETVSGSLSVSRDGDALAMDFPRDTPRPHPIPDGMGKAIGARPMEVWKGKDDLMVVVDSQQTVAALKPDFARIAQFNARGLIVTAKCEGEGEADFVSRFFAPRYGIGEDPVTGSAHCLLGPYWEKRLKKRSFLAHQISSRGGVVGVEVGEERVLLKGRAALYMEGRVHLP